MRLQKDALSESGALRDIIYAYERVLHHLDGLTSAEIQDLLSRSEIKNPMTESLLRTDLVSLTLEQVEAVVSDLTTKRKELEAIAVSRFSVPRGSLRSLGNINDLRDRLFTLVHNERTHRTIAEVASRNRN